MSHGLAVSVEVGDSVPLLAIEDALAEFDADEIVISTLPPSQSHWLDTMWSSSPATALMSPSDTWSGPRTRWVLDLEVGEYPRWAA